MPKRRIPSNALELAAMALRPHIPGFTSKELEDVLNARSKTYAPASTGPDRLVKMGEAARLLSVSSRTVWTWARTGRLHPVKLSPGHAISNGRVIGGRVAFRLSEIEAIVRGIPA